MSHPPSKTVRGTIWQFTLRRTLIAITLLGIWLASNVEAVREREDWMRQLGNDSHQPSFCLVPCASFAPILVGDIPLSWRACGATPLEVIHLDGNEFSQQEALEMAMLFPEAAIMRSVDRQDLYELQLHYQPELGCMQRLTNLIGW